MMTMINSAGKSQTKKVYNIQRLNFCYSDTLTHPDLLEFLHHHQIIVWGGNVRYTEAFQVSNTLQATTYPFLAIIALQPPSSTTTSTTTTSTKMSVIDRIEGPILAAAMIRRFESVMTRVDPSLNHLRSIRQQREQDRQLRQQQDQAYRDALQADQRKQERAGALLRKQKEAERAKALHRQQRQQYIQWLCTQVNRQHQQVTGKATKISFRLASGERVIRRFAADQTLASLYMFVEAYPYLNDMEGSEVVAPEGYVHKYDFTLHSPFPRTEYGPDEAIKIEDVKGLWPSATLIVDAVEDDDDEDEGAAVDELEA
jgi:FAS-associated factor 2